MTERPILEAIRAILKFKDYATVAEVAQMAGTTRRVALDTINRNGHLVWRDRKSGRITKVEPRSELWKKLWESGAFYRTETYDYGSTRGLSFSGHDELKAELLQKTWGGGFGDSYRYEYVPDTPENRARLEATGCLPSEKMVIDDRLWIEGDALATQEAAAE